MGKTQTPEELIAQIPHERCLAFAVAGVDRVSIARDKALDERDALRAQNAAQAAALASVIPTLEESTRRCVYRSHGCDHCKRAEKALIIARAALAQTVEVGHE